ncbi:hypothetical protein [Luteimonas fraxinea]|uniref:hypothetical protein n=1 Tax=Luteimonas fraxinea TaxID=2901869 RepID=UPI001E4E823B|nr:hypothetical protein [Luteimonas fraxinea]MCD9124221.1 hypothetical protein [Luteimonas fraxinea]
MRRFFVWVVPTFGALILGKLVDTYFPTVFPAAISSLTAPVPAWSLISAIGAAAYLGYRLWSATSVNRVAPAPLATRFSPAEQIVLIFLSRATAELDEDSITGERSRDGQYTPLQIKAALHSLYGQQLVNYHISGNFRGTYRLSQTGFNAAAAIE